MKIKYLILLFLLNSITFSQNCDSTKIVHKGFSLEFHPKFYLLITEEPEILKIDEILSISKRQIWWNNSTNEFGIDIQLNGIGTYHLKYTDDEVPLLDTDLKNIICYVKLYLK